MEEKIIYFLNTGKAIHKPTKQKQVEKTLVK